MSFDNELILYIYLHNMYRVLYPDDENDRHSLPSSSLHYAPVYRRGSLNLVMDHLALNFQRLHTLSILPKGYFFANAKNKRAPTVRGRVVPGSHQCITVTPFTQPCSLP